MKLLETFSGIGSQYRALKNIAIEIEESYISEIDKFSINTYEKINNHTPINLGDITKIEKIPNVDLLTYSFPCTDISTEGLGKGLYEGKHSSLLWEVKRILENNSLPKDLLMENVAAILNKNHKKGLDEWITFLECKGYKNWLFKLDASDFGIPQHRERTFLVSRLEGEFTIPKPLNKNVVLNDILEHDVDEKYYRDKYLTILDRRIRGNKLKYMWIDTKFLSYAPVYLPDSIMGTIVSNGSMKRFKVYINDRIRILTEKELIRLMGFKDEDYEKIKDLSTSRIQFMMGNSIVVNVLEEIFKNMYIKNN